jgi:hypothetical protein
MPSELTTEERIRAFKQDLGQHTVPVMVQKYITYGDCFALSQASYFDLKSGIASEFGLHPSQVMIVGSAKLGFSIVKWKRYRPFGDTSDIDVAIISPELFDELWINVYEYWQAGGYWDQIADFQEYLFRGWLRPDKLPPSRSFAGRRQWWEFFRRLTNSREFGDFQIRAGLYKSWYFLESYQAGCINQCREELKPRL